MKRFSIMLLALIMCMSLCACAGEQSGYEEDYEEDGEYYLVEDMEVGSNLGTFVSEDLFGNEVTDAIFAQKDVTIVNVWATFCGPCIEEMPDLQALSEELPDNAQVIGIVIDATPANAESPDEGWGAGYENVDLAKEIVSEAGVNYTNILASDSVAEMLYNVEAVPTTFIVDSSGNLVCKAIVGADVESYRNAVEEYLGM